MRIAEIRPHVLRHDLERHFQSAFSTFATRWACLVEVICDDGTVGWGECLGPSAPNAAAGDPAIGGSVSIRPTSG